MKKVYLLTYNGACAAGWAFCTARAVSLLMVGANAEDLWKEIGMVLTIVQSMMLLEVLHSLIGLVSSPVVTVAIQVSSRILLVWGHLYWVPQCQQHWSLFMMVISWGITEVVRYLFYFFGLLGGAPYPLFFLRYTLFMVLYPTGITGEVLQMVVAMGAHWKVVNPVWYRVTVIILVVYLPASPAMIQNMLANRRRSFKKMESAKQELEGIVWPVTKQGDRSSTSTNRKILAAAASAGPGGTEAAAKIAKEKNWRFMYNKHMLDHVGQSLESAEGCLKMADAGLAAAQDTFGFIRKGAPEITMKDAMVQLSAELFDTAELHGASQAPSKHELSLRYGGPTSGMPYYQFEDRRNTLVKGLPLREQLDAWVEYGTIEKDVADALKTVQLNQEKWLDLSDMYFVLLGAASAMGPLHFLLSLGANVVAVARPKALRGILRAAKDTPGKVIFPVKKGTDWQGMVKAGDVDGLSKAGGCDLLTQTPEIATWVTTVAPGKRLTIGNYTYLDGALHVQIAVACDCIIERLCKSRKDTAIAFLGTPTDAHVIPPEAAAVANEAYERAPSWMKLCEAAGLLKPNKARLSGGMHVLDTIVPAQGPNYILSKRLQHWRAMVARAAGHTVSSNISPSSATSSVTKNASFAAAYGGMHIFKPVEIAYEELSLSLMGALLIHDLRNPESVANPSTPLQHPLCLFQATGCHFGVWRCPYTIDTIGVPSAVVYYITMYWVRILACAMVLGAILQWTAYGNLPLPGPIAVGLSVVPDMMGAPLTYIAEALSLPL